MNALDTQIGGGHYKGMAIQPMEYSMANGLDACQHTAIKYISRFREKGGIQDLEKAKHCIDMLVEFERKAMAGKKAPSVEWPVDDSRIDAIGQNGNTGEHYDDFTPEPEPIQRPTDDLRIDSSGKRAPPKPKR